MVPTPGHQMKRSLYLLAVSTDGVTGEAGGVVASVSAAPSHITVCDVYHVHILITAPFFFHSSVVAAAKSRLQKEKLHVPPLLFFILFLVYGKKEHDKDLTYARH